MDAGTPQEVREAKGLDDDEILPRRWSLLLEEFIRRLTVLGKGGTKRLQIAGVPEKLRKLKEDAYSPRVVSVGFFHVGNALEAIEQHKPFYKKSFIDRTYNIEVDEASGSRWNWEEFQLSDDYIYVKDLGSGYYTDSDELLLNGCFILELFLRLATSLNYITLQQYESDPVINSVWMIRALLHDLALLENQISFVILEVLYDIIKPHLVSKCEAPESVSSLALDFFKPMISPNRSDILKEQSYNNCRHLLDLLHKASCPASTAVVSIDIIDRRVLKKYEGGSLTHENQYWGLDYCASELVQSGIDLCRESEDSLVNLIFSRNGGMIKIPPVFIDDVRDSLYTNLIAYEQSSMKTKQQVTSYAILMRTLIRSPRDVKLLRKKG